MPLSSSSDALSLHIHHNHAIFTTASLWDVHPSLGGWGMDLSVQVPFAHYHYSCIHHNHTIFRSMQVSVLLDPHVGGGGLKLVFSNHSSLTNYHSMYSNHKHGVRLA